MIKCDRCDGDTIEKRITSRKDGQEYVMQECQNGCMDQKNPKWRYSFFPKNAFGKKQPASRLSVAFAKPDISVQIQQRIAKIEARLTVIEQEILGKEEFKEGPQF